MAILIQEAATLSPLEDRLSDVIPGYRFCLERKGLGSSGVRRLAGAARHRVTWKHINRIGTRALDIRRVAEVAFHDCTCPGRLQAHASPRTREQADRFLAFLIDAGLAEMPSSIVEGGTLAGAFIASQSDNSHADRRMRGDALRSYILDCQAECSMSSLT